MSVQLAEKFILASASPRRAELLKRVGLPFEVRVSDVEELQSECDSARELCEKNAYSKADSVAQKYPGRWVIGADTLVVCENKVYGKPVDLTQARQTLEILSGKRHEVITGVALVKKNNGSQCSQKVFSVVTGVAFRNLSPEDISAYFSKTNPLDKAGAYGIQDHGEMIIEDIEGSLSNVIGLPVEELMEQLSKLGS
ncbi:MAG: septum formation protein Maf [Verrucomicrobiae bacterium]|nr:septum formation protein Maf [Verrucomicrobiae bacterium]